GVAEKRIPTIAERDLRKGVRVKVAQVAPRERATNLDPCARVRKLARWCDELVAMASTEMKFTIIRLQRRSREVRQTVQLSRRRMYHSLALPACESLRIRRVLCSCWAL